MTIASDKPRFARGWHVIGTSEDFPQGEPKGFPYFGTKIVAFRGEDGQVHVLDGYCPHMGADLSQGEVSGNSITCPFHHWQWGCDGKCEDIPYAKVVPPRAKVKVWPSVERNNLVFVWNDPEGNPPYYEIPLMDECDSGEWMPWVVDTMHIPTHPKELVDNVADKAHFGPVHGAPVSKFENRFVDHMAVQIMEATSERLGKNSLKTVATYYGPAYQITVMEGDVESRLLNCHAPIDGNSFDLRFGVMVKRIPGMSDAQMREIADAYVSKAQEAFYEDVEIWKSKTFQENPILCGGDGQILKLRQWYRQFYTDVAELSKDKQKSYLPEYCD
ncbi:Rieske 2Fe-2S domain-containing protein [Microbulbifer taiwanensis]|uniref:Rieske 2Fe-2S domain-containing protein n=1 Tax=Microbulbifer taiwanensis TaxID=986746 RepID=A0ABW1YNQ4_9GAMM